tara:strand:+ start:1762 stop:2208 length:447 start_codon:yes stop_codon:yes gene_type:complete
MKISIVSGGFDPIHVGHVELMERARALTGNLIVILNTDDFLSNKKGKVFMPFFERKKIIESIRYVDLVVKCTDTDQTVCQTLRDLASLRTLLNDKPWEELYFCNGGDRTSGENTPEHAVCKELGIESVYGLGDKIQSSSWLTKNFTNE